MNFYNKDGRLCVAFTSDVDWAPDYAIEDLLDIFASARVPISVFATHATPLLSKNSELLEVGVHPDYTRPFSNRDFAQCLTSLLDEYPHAKGVRSHRNFFGQNTAELAARARLSYDASVLMWRQTNLMPWKDQYGLTRLSYNWEDGINADFGLDWNTVNLPTVGSGIKIWNFHPIFVYLNCPTDDYRREVVRDYRDLTSAPYSVLSKKIYQGYGARSFLIDTLAFIRERKAENYLLSALVEDFNRNSEG